MLPGEFCEYIAREIQKTLKDCIVEPTLVQEPIIKKVGYVSAEESNYAVGPLTKTIKVIDVYGTRYKVSIEDMERNYE